MILQFSEKCSTWTAWDAPSCGRQYELQCNTSQQISWCGQLTAQPHLLPVDAICVRTLNKLIYAVPPRIIDTCSSCDNGWRHHIMVCWRECHVAPCHLSWHRQRPCMPSVTMTGSLYDHFIFCTIWQWHVSWELHMSRHTSCNVYHLPFNRESHYGKLVWEFHTNTVKKQLHF